MTDIDEVARRMSGHNEDRVERITRETREWYDAALEKASRDLDVEEVERLRQTPFQAFVDNALSKAA